MRTLFRIALGLIFLSPLSAFAQEENPPLVVQRFEPAPAPEDFLVTFGAPVLLREGYSLGFFSDFQQNPLSVRFVIDGRLGGDAVKVVSNQFVTHLVGAVSLFSLMEVGFGLPFFVLQNGEGLSNAGGPGLGVPSGGLGDPRLHVRAPFWQKGLGGGELSLGGVASVSLPLGNEGGFMGEKGATGTGRLIADYRRGALRVAGNLGYRARSREEFLTLILDDEILYSTALSYEVTPGISGAFEVYGSASASKDLRDLDSSPLEADLAFRFQSPSGFALTGGVGAGLVAGAGSPDFRLFAGLRYRFVPKDGDKDEDGIPDSLDKCPRKAETFNGRDDEDGCPELEEGVDPLRNAESVVDEDDEDADGIKNDVDQCPDLPEDPDKFQDEDGCPDADNDQDGIKDHEDMCPDEAEDIDTFEDQDGCPDLDNDQDSVPDEKDACPNQAEDRDGLADEDGCPDIDADRDGLSDDVDSCPAQAETLNGLDDEDGCPDEGESNLSFPENGQGLVKGAQKLRFQKNKPQILPDALPVLNELVSRMKASRNVRLTIRVAPEKQSKPAEALARERVDALVGYLVAFGVEPERILGEVGGKAGEGVVLEVAPLENPSPAL